MKIKYYLIISIILVLLTAAVSFYLSSKWSASNVIILHDTTIVDRWHYELSRDTIVKWYEKIQYYKPDPKTIYVQKVDTVFIESSKSLDLMLKVDKIGNKLYIKAINQNGKIIKEYIYDNIGEELHISSQQNNISVKSRLIYYDGIAIFAQAYSNQFKLINQFEYDIGLETGINYLNKHRLTAGIFYNKSSKFNVFIKSKFKIF
ncbi:MAG: hypothetical protein FJ216_07360 [Ignavibacteria bacterium]|nr:hypothetical protein [Ignavibacteria bacterium]